MEPPGSLQGSLQKSSLAPGTDLNTFLTALRASQGSMEATPKHKHRHRPSLRNTGLPRLTYSRLTHKPTFTQIQALTPGSTHKYKYGEGASVP